MRHGLQAKAFLPYDPARESDRLRFGQVLERLLIGS